MKGAVVVGYQGVGKSTLTAQDSSKFVDLESSCFWVDGGRYPQWYIPYVNLAVDIASQGHVVFVSSHKEVRDYLRFRDFPEHVHFCGCVPSLSLEELWIDKLRKRWVDSNEVKDYKAYMNAKDRYAANIQEIKDDISVICEITSMEYDLNQLLEETFRRCGW